MRGRGSTGGESILVIGIVLGLASSSCARGAPPAPQGIDAAVSPLPAPGVVSSGSPSAKAGAAGSAEPAGHAAPESAAAASSNAAAPVDAGDPGALPQTRDKPTSTSAALDTRTRALWDGIVQDDPDRAMPFFFPVTAYEQVKAIPSPASDWRRRLVSAYKRDVHGLNKRLGDKAQSAKLVRIEIPEDRARWVEPNEESNKLGYWRVYGTHIVYEVDGKERALDISSLISWRGEWYVVHLTGFK